MDLQGGVFAFASDNKVWWPVPINVPQDGGSTKVIEVAMLFTIPKVKELESLTGNDDDDVPTLAKYIHDWQNITDAATGNAMEFTQERLLAFMENPYIRIAVIRALRNVASGVAVKN